MAVPGLNDLPDGTGCRVVEAYSSMVVLRPAGRFPDADELVAALKKAAATLR